MKHGIRKAGTAALASLVFLNSFAFSAAAEQVDPLTEWGQYDALIEEARTETDAGKRAELLHQAEDMLMASYCVIPLYYYNSYYLLKDYVTGVYKDSHDRTCFMYASMGNGADTLNAYAGWDISTADPCYAFAAEDMTLINHLFSGLFMYDENGQIVPACAEGYTVSEDGLVYTITLKEGLKWSDGSDLTAADFAYSWKRAVNGFSDYNYLFAMLNGDLYGDITDLQVTAVDERTLQFTLSAPCAYAEDLLTMPVFFPVPQSYSAPYENTEDPGAWSRQAGYPSNGAYTLSEWSGNGSITLTKNPYWFDADRVTTEHLVLYYGGEDESVPYQYYIDGVLDYTAAVPQDAAAQMFGSGQPEFYNVPTLGTCYLTVNAGSPLFAGKTADQAAAMREAFSILIDREKLCSLMQSGIPAASYIPAGMADGNHGIFEEQGYYDAAWVSHDPEAALQKARELLESAGYAFDESGMLSADTPLTCTFSITDSPMLQTMASAIREDFAALGIGLNVDSYIDYSGLQELRASGAAEILRSGWFCDTNDPFEMLEQMTTDNNQSACGFGNN